MGKLLKQAQQMQAQMQSLQADMAKREIEVSQGGGAVKVRVSLNQEVRGLHIEPDFLKEDAALVTETLLQAIQEAQQKAAAESQAAMQGVTQGLSIPGLF